MLIPDGTDARREYRVRIWLLKLGITIFTVTVVGILAFFIFYGEMVRRAAITEQVQAENEQLSRYRYKVQLLEENMKQAREIVSRLTELAGIDYTFPELPSDSVLLADENLRGGAVIERAGEDVTLPRGLPIPGFITQDFETEDPEHFHPGIDIACSIGTPVLSTGAGEVVVAEFDSTYGYMVVIQNNDSIRTVFGHNDSLLVGAGEKVQVGSRIALSGNTGVSTAPHLHYEVRINNQPINPLEGLDDEERQ